jgi:hypothetical protein
MKKNNETSLVYSCLDYLSKIGVPSWRNNSGGMKKGKHFIKFGDKGSPDILGIAPGGRLLCVECKMPGNNLTKHQAAWLERAAKHGAAVCVAYSIDDLFFLVGDRFVTNMQILNDLISRAESE